MITWQKVIVFGVVMGMAQGFVEGIFKAMGVH